jgi:hypothetical protein
MRKAIAFNSDCAIFAAGAVPRKARTTPACFTISHAKKKPAIHLKKGV